MRNFLLRFYCFLTGYNYFILSGCSEDSVRTVKRFGGALMIMCLLWGFIGYSFATRYVNGTWWVSTLSGLILVFIVVNIERQIILTSQRTKAMIVFRTSIAFVMALIGSVIIDQIILKEDIEKQKLVRINQEVGLIYPAKANELNRQIQAMDSAISRKENQRNALVDELTKNPTIRIVGTTIQREDSAESKTISITRIPNPKASLIPGIDEQIDKLRVEKSRKEDLLLEIRPTIEAELKEKVGFLDELAVMFQILSASIIAFGVWILWIVLLVSLELFILMSKLKDGVTDYDQMINQQKELHLLKIRLLVDRSGS